MAKWKPFDLTWGRSIYYCTECKEGIEVPTSCGKPMYKFCPMCGARMDTADTPQTEMDKCYKCKWWNYSYGCSNKKGICEFEPIADTPQTKQGDSEYYLELADAVMRGEMSDAEANQAWYEYINKQDAPQTEVYDYKGNGKWERSE